MRRALLLAALAGLLAACGGGDDGAEPRVRAAQLPPAAALWPAPVAYEVDAAWSARRRTLAGTTTLRFRNDGPDPLRSVWLRTWPNAFASCRRPIARLELISGGELTGTRHRCTARRVRLDGALAAGAQAALRIAYAVRVPSRSDRFGVLGRTAFLGSALPTLAVRDSEGWRLPPYTHRGEAWFTLAAPWQVRLTLPRGLRVAITGAEQDRRALAGGRAEVTSATPAARDVAMVIGPLTERTARAGDITLRHHSLPEGSAAGAERVLQTARRALERYQSWWGPYGRSELDLVQGPARVAARGVAMEYPELVLVPPSPGAVAHEVAHQWWAMLMGNDPWREPWLDESFAEYAQARLPDAIGGPDRLRGCPRPSDPPRLPLTATMGGIDRAAAEAYVRVVYIGGACTLRRLQGELGTTRLDGVLRGLVADRRDGTWTTADLVSALRAAAPDGFDVGRFLRREGLG